jgi:hypothetical protein
VVAHATGQLIRVVRIRRLLGVPVETLLPWKTLGTILAVAATAALLARASILYATSPLTRVLVGLPLFGAGFLAAAFRFDLIPAQERERIDAWVRRLLRLVPFRAE